MQIFVDADACPVVGIVEKVAKEHDLPVTLLCDHLHVCEEHSSNRPDDQVLLVMFFDHI